MYRQTALVAFCLASVLAVPPTLAQSESDPVFHHGDFTVGTGSKAHFSVEAVMLSSEGTGVVVSFGSEDQRLRGTLHPPGTESAFHLRTESGGRYDLANQDGWGGADDGGYGGRTIPQGLRGTFTLAFEPLPAGTRRFDLIEGTCEEGCWNVYDIQVRGEGVSTRSLAALSAERLHEQAVQASKAGDHFKAARLWGGAAGKGLAPAQNMLGVVFYRGQGVNQSGIAASRFFSLAAEQGNADAQNNLGHLYANGINANGQGIPRDFDEAARWYGLAAEQGHEGAAESLRELPARRERYVDRLREAEANRAAAARAKEAAREREEEREQRVAAALAARYPNTDTDTATRLRFGNPVVIESGPHLGGGVYYRIDASRSSDRLVLDVDLANDDDLTLLLYAAPRQVRGRTETPLIKRWDASENGGTHRLPLDGAGTYYLRVMHDGLGMFGSSCCSEPARMTLRRGSR